MIGGISMSINYGSKILIRTSGRRTFRRCIRKWGFQSGLKMNLDRIGSESNIHFWFGSAIHWAMEDYFGYNKFGDPRRAFKAYYDCFDEIDKPMLADTHYDLGIGMLTYFLEWLPRHNQTMQFKTLWLTHDENGYHESAPGVDGAYPAVEQSFELDLGVRVVRDPISKKIYYRYKEGDNIDYPLFSIELPTGEINYYVVEQDGRKVDVEICPVVYHGTFDRLVIDRFGRWWILDYKTAKGADTNKLDTDDQISAYLWAAEQWFQHKIHGFVYLQLTKEVPKPPRRLKNGSLSVDKKQKTTYGLYRDEVIKDYGDVSKAPANIIDALNTFAEQETPEGDKFIRWDFVTRTDAQKISTYHNIMAEVMLQTDPNLILFPNPTRDCIWDCPFRDVCIAMDDDRMDEAQAILDANYAERSDTDESNHEEWKDRLVYPTGPVECAETPDEFVSSVDNIFNIILPPEYMVGDEYER